MNIEKLTKYIDDLVWASLLSVHFSERMLDLLIATNDGRKFELSCQEVTTFRVADDHFDLLELTDEAPELLAYSGPKTTYVLWGDAVDWPRVIGRLVQEFGAVSDFMSPAHVAETLKYADYRLPVNVPRALEAKFQVLLAELGVNPYGHSRSEAQSQPQLLRFGAGSFIIAEKFEVVEVVP